MNLVALAGSIVVNATVLAALAIACKTREPHVSQVATSISVVPVAAVVSVVEAEPVPTAGPAPIAKPAEQVPPAPITSQVARAALPTHARSSRGATAALPPSREIVFVPDPPPQQQPPHRIVLVPDPPQQQPPQRAVSSPEVPRFDAPGMRPLPHQTASIVPDYDWAWGNAGAVRMQVGVRPTGEISSVTFLSPSGSQSLDAALEAAIRARTFAPCVTDGGEAIECTVDYRFDYAVTRHANGVREARTCGHVEDGQPSCCDAFER